MAASQPSGEKARLFDLLVHDLRGPLSIVTASTNSLRHKPERYGPLTNGQQRILDRILRNADKAQNLVQEMIEVLRSEQGVFESTEFSVEAVVKAALTDALEITAPDIAEALHGAPAAEQADALLRTHGIHIHVTGAYRNAPFRHDERKIQHILRNLMSNAVKYRRTRVQVQVAGSLDLIITVEDDGPGIAAAERASVFAPFVQVHDASGSAASGLGFGLAAVKTLIDAMDGDIAFESRQGVGTRFTVRIPPMG